MEVFTFRETGISWNDVLFPQCQFGHWLFYLYFLFTVICSAWLNIQAPGSFPNYSHHILLMDEHESRRRGTCASVYMPARCLEVQRQEGISKKYAAGKVWLIYAVSHHCCNTKAINLLYNWRYTLRSSRPLYNGKHTHTHHNNSVFACYSLSFVLIAVFKHHEITVWKQINL